MNSTSGISISIGRARERWSASTRSAVSTCQGLTRRLADRITCCYSCRRRASARRPADARGARAADLAAAEVDLDAGACGERAQLAFDVDEPLVGWHRPVQP